MYIIQSGDEVQEYVIHCYYYTTHHTKLQNRALCESTCWMDILYDIILHKVCTHFLAIHRINQITLYLSGAHSKDIRQTLYVGV